MQVLELAASDLVKSGLYSWGVLSLAEKQLCQQHQKARCWKWNLHHCLCMKALFIEAQLTGDLLWCIPIHMACTWVLEPSVITKRVIYPFSPP